ncbi:MAG TPA: archease [Syntrophorhabdaceae bacterium]|nr:archease [Syntrophorhabdaceae bacterium]HOL04630.1 archease [Syntrophorhabdaceae bacterium]HPP41313.1 archease [Syntrophorhabdaceae bacterium]
MARTKDTQPLKYRIIDHEADIGLEIYGKSLEELFINAAEGLFHLIIEGNDIRPEKGKRLEIGKDGELLINFINELLFLWDTEGFIPKEFSIKIEDDEVKGSVIGGLFDPRRLRIKQEIKAATYHMFSLIEEGGIYKARVILDV